MASEFEKPTTDKRKQAVILGGGVAGLAAGWRLSRGWQVTVVERSAAIGGLCGTFSHQGMRLDYGPHKCFSLIPDVLRELRVLMGDEMLHHQKRNSIYLFGRYLSYPLQIPELLAGMGIRNGVIAGASAVLGRLQPLFRRPPESYRDYVVSRFGSHVYTLVFEPLAQKVWGDPETLSADIARLRIPSSGFLDVMFRLMKMKRETAQTNAEFFYYPEEGFGRIPDRMAQEIGKQGGEVWTSSEPVSIHHEGHRITGVTVERSGESVRLPCDLLISTIPFDGLGTLMQRHRPDPALEEMLSAADRLQYRHLVLVYVVVKADLLTRDHWIFFPERSWVFGRIFEQKQMSRNMVPDGKTVICCDITDDEEGERWQSSDASLGERCVSDLRAAGILNGQSVLETFVKRSRRFYPRYDLLYRQTLSRLYAGLKRYENLLSTGRIGLYNYNNSDHCLDMAMRIEEGLAAGRGAPEIMDLLEERVNSYRIVD